jgi:hypothetical protein
MRVEDVMMMIPKADIVAVPVTISLNDLNAGVWER